MKVSWFSAGVSSAVATKLSNPDVIIYNHIDDQHPDTMRFIEDCEKWFGKKITITNSYVKSVEGAIRLRNCISIPGKAAPCTDILKRRERKLWEHDNPGRHTYIWGYDEDEGDRAAGLFDSMPEHNHEFPLIANQMSKGDCHGLLRSVGIGRPIMYDMGYPNNNCIGFIRGGMWYWNKIRKDFPAIFESRAKLERLIGHSIIKGVYLDELEDGRGRESDEISQECGVSCYIASLNIH